MIKEYFEKILDNYLNEKMKPMQANSLAFSIRSSLPQEIRIKSYVSSHYFITGSAGQGNLAKIPWIGVFDRDITDTAQKGYYIVYLFDANMDGVYLSLNQGWAQYQKQYGIKKGKNKIRHTTKILQ